MKTNTLLLTYSIVFGLLMSACNSSKEDISPNATQADLISQNLALTKSIQKTWNTELVHDKDVLVYARNIVNNSVDYGKFQLDLKKDSKFSMIDTDGNKIEGECYLAEGNILNLEYDKEDFKSCATTVSTSQVCTITTIVVTISLKFAKVPSKNELYLQNNTVDYVMKTAQIE